jgi:hypothetical protein
MDEQARMKILEMIDSGKISAEDGLRLLQSLSKSEQESDEVETTMEGEVRGTASVIDLGEFLQIDLNKPPKKPAPSAETQPEVPSAAPAQAGLGENEFMEATAAAYSEQASTQDQETPADTEQPRQDSRSGPATPLPSDVEKWRRWWMIPLWVGIGVTVVCGALMYQSFVNQGFGFWFVCLWLPFFLGVALMALSYGSRNSRWLHLRVDQKPGERPQHIAISMPLPIRFVTWLYHNFGHYVPDLQDKPIEEILNAVAEGTNAENPLYVEVNEDDGERVKVYIG